MFNNKSHILLIDDDLDILDSYQDLLEQEGYYVQAVSEPMNIDNQLSMDWNGVVICDVLLPEISGLDLLDQIIEIDERIPVIMITGHGDVPMAVEAVKKGAINFLEKPISPDKLLSQVKQAALQRNSVIEKRHWQINELNKKFIGSSEWIGHLKSRLQKLASSNVPTFLWGEDGTGRHLAANYLHQFSDRSEQPIIFFECCPDDHIHLEQLICEVAKGTLVIQNGHFLHVNDQNLLANLLQRDKFEFRLIMISDISLTEWARTKSIIPELYHWFLYTQIEMLPLKKHQNDIIEIFIHYVKQTCERLNREYVAPDKKILTSLVTREWIGNVKELINVAELYAIGLLPTLTSLRMSNSILFYPEDKTLDEQVAEYEKNIIEQTLIFYRGRVNDVAAHLDIPRKKLYLRMKKYGIDKNNYKLS